MISVGIRELKARLGAYVQQARAGEVIVVTDRGRPVAEMRATEPMGAGRSAAQRYQDAVAAGSLRPPARPGDRSWLEGPSAGLPAGTAAELLDAERSE